MSKKHKLKKKNFMNIKVMIVKIYKNMSKTINKICYQIPLFAILLKNLNIKIKQINNNNKDVNNISVKLNK